MASVEFVRLRRSMAINHTSYETYPGLLISVVAIEMTINVCILAFLPIFCRIVWKSGVVHRNFRLQLCNTACLYCLGTASRFYLFYVQFSGVPDEEIVDFFYPAQTIRAAENIISVSIIGAFALERTIATYKWSWYEKGSNSTILVYLLIESMNLFSFLLHEKITNAYSLDVGFIQIMSVGILGILWFTSIYRTNQKLWIKMKAGAQVGSYSVAQAFQVRENVEVLKYMSWMGRGWIVSTVTCFAAYAYFAFGPIGYDATRALAYNIYEIFVALNVAAFYTLSITGNSHILRQFRKMKIIRVFLNSRRLEESKKNAVHIRRNETDHLHPTLKKAGSMSAAAPYVQGCYLANWAVYNPPPHKFTPANIPIGLCTHIFYASAAVNITTFEATSSDYNADVTLGNFDALNNLKKQQPGLKTVLSFGEWGESQTGIYSVLASDPAKISTFVKSAWAMADQYGFDGIDLDWEYPEAKDRFNYIDLLKALREASGGKLLTAAVPGSDNLIGYNTLEMDEYLDFFNIMTYDFYGDDDPVVQHHAAYSETIHALQLWNLRGASKSKLLMGIPAYGVGWTADVCALGAPASGPADPNNDEAAYYDLVAMTGQVIDTPEGPLLQTTIKGKNKCYGFDNPASVSKKMAFVTSQDYAGAFTWSVDMDDAAFNLHYAINLEVILDRAYRMERNQRMQMNRRNAYKDQFARVREIIRSSSA